MYSILLVLNKFQTDKTYKQQINDHNYCLDSSDDKYSVKIGNREWMLKHEHEVSEEINIRMEEHEEKGETVVLVSIDGRCYNLDLFS